MPFYIFHCLSRDIEVTFINMFCLCLLSHCSLKFPLLPSKQYGFQTFELVAVYVWDVIFLSFWHRTLFQYSILFGSSLVRPVCFMCLCLELWTYSYLSTNHTSAIVFSWWSSIIYSKLLEGRDMSCSCLFLSMW
jgi:hypothetical protein